MKEDESVSLSRLVAIFISHMVQMKDLPYSRNTDYVENFISHMVQMKAASKAEILCETSLYIPHGSDER